MSELIDVHGIAHGQPYRGRDSSTSTDLRTTPGPCGNALSFNAPSLADRWFVEIDSSGHRVVPLSVDFWVYLAPEGFGPQAGILTRDQDNNNAGDFTLSQIQDGTNARIVVRTQSDLQDHFTCSGALDRQSWHHIAVNIGEGMEVQLFVDGVHVKQTGDTVTHYAEEVTCLASKFVGDVDLELNQWPWIIGASNAGSTSTDARVNQFFVGGALDNLRIRNALFTAAEARAIYEP